MTTVEVGIWSLAGFVLASGLRAGVSRMSVLPPASKRLALPGLLEVITAGLFAALALRRGWAPDLFAYSWLAAVGVLLAAIDWTSLQLPTKLIWPAGVIMAVLLAAAAIVHGEAHSLICSAAGMVTLLVFYGTLYFLQPSQLGGGDLRLSGLLGLALGWAGWTAILSGTLIGWSTAAVALVILRTVRRREPHQELPLGPFLVLGAIAAVLIQPAP